MKEHQRIYVVLGCNRSEDSRVIGVATSPERADAVAESSASAQYDWVEFAVWELSEDGTYELLADGVDDLSLM